MLETLINIITTVFTGHSENVYTMMTSDRLTLGFNNAGTKYCILYLFALNQLKNTFDSEMKLSGPQQLEL